MHLIFVDEKYLVFQTLKVSYSQSLKLVSNPTKAGGHKRPVSIHLKPLCRNQLEFLNKILQILLKFIPGYFSEKKIIWGHKFWQHHRFPYKVSK